MILYWYQQIPFEQECIISIKLNFFSYLKKCIKKEKKVAGQVVHRGYRVEKIMPQKNNLRNYWIGWVNQKEQDENYPLYKNTQHARASWW